MRQMKNLLNKIKNFVLRNKKTSIFLAVVLLIAFVFAANVIYKKYSNPIDFLTSLSDEQQVALGRFIGDAYQNIYGYKTICKTEDIILEKYPEAYKKAMASELELLNNILSEDDLTLESAISLFLPYNELQLINNALYQEMRSIADANEKGIKTSCILFEEQAEVITVGLAKVSNQKYGDIIRSILK